jgi:hypothetical protein
MFVLCVCVCVCCVVLSGGRADHLSREILPTVARLCVWSRNLVRSGDHSLRWAAVPEKIIIINNFYNSNKGLLEECVKKDSVAAAITSCVKI